MAFLTRWRVGMGGDEGSSDGVGTEVGAMEAETAARGAPQGERRATAASPPGANSTNHSMLLPTIATARTMTGEASYQLIGA
ncbi:hypothetical protein MUK42_02652 [Musa troglodytarum]|uniref:Uncharacterized protein n=1 Tax=Musa troglodytarum TaxID=320322 RepID=A0A9E7EH33_9LILI|nr:hypothetical protein MUK42_02652 [Musa troglodytarum]